VQNPPAGGLPLGGGGYVEPQMFTTLAWLTLPRTPARYELAFVRAVTAREPIARNAWAERLILAGWLAIVFKRLLVIWIIDQWAVPFQPYWINVPTIAMGALITAIYLRRDRG
jgi:hypothetical protein